MADTLLARTPALARLIRCLSGGLDVAFELFSSELAPLLPAIEDRTAAALRQAVAISQDDAVRAAFDDAHADEAVHRIGMSGLVVDVRLIRDGRRAVALLAAATPASGDTTSAERQMNLAGEAIQRLLEADLQHTREGGALERKSRGWMRLLGHLPGLSSEAELLGFFLLALAVWHDLDTRVYVRDASRRFVLAARLPGDRTEGRAQLPAELVERPWPARISSVAELEGLGWYGPPYELTVIPIGPQTEATHAVAIHGVLDAGLEVAVLAGCRILDACLERIITAEEQRLADRFSRRLHEIGELPAPGLRALMQSLIDVLAQGAGAERGAVRAAGQEAPQAEGSRFLVPLNLPGVVRALEFSTSSAAPFTVRHMRLARVGARLFELWLLGLNQAGQLLERERQARDGRTEGGSRAV